MNLFKNTASLLSLCGLVVANGAFAQISTINSANIHPREFNDIPAATLTVVSNYPSLISFQEQNVSKATGFANRDVWRFSKDGGVTPYHFGNDEFFSVFMTVTTLKNSSLPK